MKNSKELVELAKSFQPKLRLDEDYFSSAQHQFEETDEINFACAGMGIARGGDLLYGNGSSILIGRNKIVLAGMVGSSDALRGFTELNKSDIREVTVRRTNMIYGQTPVLQTKEGEEYCLILYETRAAKKIAEAMKREIRKIYVHEQSSLSPADEIRKLMELRDEGILSEEEFTAGKRRILGMEQGEK